MLATVTIYKNTGFNKENIPDGPGALPSGTQMNNHVFLQKRGLGFFDLEGDYNDIQNVDYVKIDNEFYFVTGFEMLNENCARMFLEVDAVTSIGISNMTFSSGQTERWCPSNNTLFSNIQDEPFVPAEEFVVEDGGNIGAQSTTSNESFVGATVDLANVNYEAKTYIDTALQTGDSVLVPQLPLPADKTEFSIYTSDSVSAYNELPAICFYDLTNATIKANIATVRSLGVENSITYAYQVPSAYCRASSNTATGQINSIAGVTAITEASGISYTYGSYTPKEKKAYSGQFHKIQMVATLSGEKSQFYKPEDIRESSESHPYFRYYTDPQPVGTVYFRPKCYKGNSSNWLIESIKGIQWRNVPISYEGRSGQAYRDYERSEQKVKETIGVITSTASGAISGAEQGATYGTNGMIAGAAIGATVGFAKQMAERGKSQFAYEYEKNIVAPEVNFTRSEGLQSYYKNDCYVWGFHLSDADLQRFDDFLIRYGWADFKKFEKTDLFTRPHFNYIKCKDLNFSANAPLQMRTIAKAQLEGGVRIQHEVPNNAAYSSNT